MLLDVPLQVLHLREAQDPSSLRPHRHDFLMLLWITKGTGVHEVNFRKCELVRGRVLFVREGQVHRVVRQPEEGWMILFQAALFRQFEQRYPAHQQHGLFDYLNREPFTDLDEQTKMVFAQVLPLLQAAASRNPLEPVIADYLSVLLYHANQLFRPLHPFIAHPVQAEQIRRLKSLIDQHYITERTAPFYSARLGMANRKLNELALKLTGKRVHDLVNDRLLSEAEALLGGTSLTIKEITFELAFIDHAHFAAFFKRQKGITPSAFRKQVTSSYS